MFHIGLVKSKWISIILGRTSIVLLLVLGLIGSQPARAAQAAGGYINPYTAPRILNLSTSVDQVVGLSNGKIAMITGAYGAATPVVTVVNVDGSQVYSTDLGSTFGARSSNKMAVNLYPIANGEVIVTIEGTSSGCDNNTDNPFQFLRLSASGSVVTPLTDISTETKSYNCYTDMAELSNGNLAFTYQTDGDSYAMRIMQPDGSAVTSPISVQKTGTGNDTCSVQSAYSATISANGTGNFLITHHCYSNTNLYGTLYTNDGSQVTIGGAQHFSLGTYTSSPNASVMGLTDNNFMVAYNSGSGYVFKKVTPTGTITSAGSYTSTGGYPSFEELGDGGFVAYDSRVVSGGGFDTYYDTGTIFANDGSPVQTATEMDSTYSDQCDLAWNCIADMWVSPSAGYARGILYVNNHTHDLVMHSFGASTPPPTATTNAASSISSSGATLNGTVNANNATTTVTFDYGLTTAYGTTSSATPGTVSGSSNTAVSLGIGGLNPNTTYHYRVVAVSTGGTTVGGDMTFTTSAVVPTAFTGSATEVGSTNATLNGTVNANNASTVVTFDYGTDTGYGNNVAATPSPLNGMISETVSVDLSGLTPNTIYHFRVKAVNSAGTTYGDDATFTTGAIAPTATTNAASGVTSNEVTLNGTVKANNSSTTVTFEYGTTLAYGTIVTAVQSPVNGMSDTPVSYDLGGLVPNTTYYYRVFAQNSAGSTYGGNQTFTTDAVVPDATTGAATGVSAFGASLNGSVTANNSTTTVTFEYGLTTGYGTSLIATPSLATGMIPTPVNYVLSGLVPNTTYHFRVVAVNSAGTTLGLDQTFTTDTAAPVATTNAAGGVSSSGATLNGTVNANNSPTTVTFEYGPTGSYGSTITAEQSPLGGAVGATVSATLTGLVPNSTYHFRVVAQNSAGTTYGSDLTFTTEAVVPTASTDAATDVTSSGATLNASVNANNASTSVSFEYGLTDSYGFSATADQSPVSGLSSTAVSKVVSGLNPNTTYHFRVVAVNTAGTTYGLDQAFTTSAIAPTATTIAAGGIGSFAATFNGLVNANNADTTVTFEYGFTTSYGSSIAATPGTATGLGDTSVSSAVSGLVPGKTYHYRVVAQNSAGTTYGLDQSFITDSAVPSVTTETANGITSNDAILNGTVNPNNDSATVTFEYGLTVAYGSTASATESPVSGITGTSVSAGLTGLIPNTTYHFRVSATNSTGTTNGLDQTFTTLPEPPAVTTNPASGITSSGATLNGTVNANNGSTTVTFEYGLTVSYGSSMTAVQSPVSGTSDTAVSADLTGLIPNTTYHFRVVGENAGGSTNGLDQTFTTEAIPPAATTNAASGVSAFGVALNGTVNANNADSAVTFEYGLTDAYGSTVTADESPVSGLSDTAVSKTLSGLIPGSTYNYRVVAQNSAGTTYGLDETFTTDAAAPAATTQAASGLSSSGATLNGVVNPNNDTATVTFEYGLDTGYGMSAPAVQSPLDGYNPTSVSLALIGLLPNTNYHYRVVAQNSTGTTYGLDMTFTTGKYFYFFPFVWSSTGANPGPFMR